MYCNKFNLDNENQAVDGDVLALDQSSNSNELVVQEDNTQSEYVPAICAPVEDNCDMDTADDVIEAIETNAMKEMRGTELFFLLFFSFLFSSLLVIVVSKCSTLVRKRRENLGRATGEETKTL